MEIAAEIDDRGTCKTKNTMDGQANDLNEILLVLILMDEHAILYFYICLMRYIYNSNPKERRYKKM